MKDKLASIYIGITLAMSTLVIVLMLVTGKSVRQEVTAQDATASEEEVQSGLEWYIADEELAENSFAIPLPMAVKEQDVRIENNYRKKQLQIHVAKISTQEGAATGISKAFFYGQPVKANALADDNFIEETTEETVLCVTFPSVWEWESKYETSLTGNMLYVQLVAPKDKYEKIVVLDAGHGGNDKGYVVQGEDEAVTLAEETLAYDVVSRAGNILEKEGVRVYYTRDMQESPADADRVSLANEVQADMLISVHADFSEDTTLYGMRTMYNETYFIPTFGSADLAYLLLEKVASSTNEKAIGFEADGGQNEMIRNAMVPVAQLNIGYLSNKQEQKLLAKDDYKERIAEGICNAVFAGYEEIEK